MPCAVHKSFAIYKASDESVISDDNLEMVLEVDDVPDKNFKNLKYRAVYWYDIKLTNKSDKTLYVH